MNGSVVFRAMLRLYPAEFRNEYGTEMLRVYADLRRDEPTTRVWLRLARDTVSAVPKLRMEEGMKRNAFIVAAVALLGVAAAGVATGNFFVGGLILIGVAAVLVIPAALLARRSGGSAERQYTIRRWPWWSFIGAGIAGMYLVFNVRQLVREPKWEHALALAFFSALSAIMIAGLRLRRSGRKAGDWMIALPCLPLFSVFWAIWPPIVAAAVMIPAMTEAFASPGRTATAV